jgi:DNA-binding Xre family transcriptional regulator
MSEIQKNNVFQLLKDKGKSKRDLANFLQIHENGINRMLTNPNIRLGRIEQIAYFLGVDISILIKVICSSKSKIILSEVGSEVAESMNDFIHETPNDNEKLVLKLSEVIKGQRIIEDTMKKNGEILTEITNLLIKPVHK